MEYEASDLIMIGRAKWLEFALCMHVSGQYMLWSRKFG